MKHARLLRSVLLTLLSGAPLAVHADPSQSVMPRSTQLFEPGPQAALEAAIRTHDRSAFRRALASGAGVNATGRFAITPLMVAVDAQDLDAVLALLAAGALPNARSADREGSVSLAARGYRARPHGRDILVAVIQGGGDPDSRQPDGDPVVMQMILAHDPAGLKLMKSLGAHLDVPDRGGDPLITNVAMAQDWDMVWALIELGAEVDYENGRSTQPLSKALGLRYPAPDSPLYPFKHRVWQFLKDRGLPVQSWKP